MDKQNTSSNYASDEKSVNLLDIFMYLLSHWKWFLISLIVFGNYFACKYSTTPYTYARSITIMVKTPANTQGAMRLNRYNSFVAPVNVSSEILQFQSKELMRRTIDILNADISYVIRNRLRPYELYSRSPIRVVFADSQLDDTYALSVTPINEQEVELSGISGFNEKEKMLVNLNDTVQLPIGSLVVYPSLYYHASWYGRPITVTKHSRESMVFTFLSKLGMKQLEEDAAVLRITLTDNSILRATDVLNTLINVYNEEALIDKNLAAEHASAFINERLEVIQKELGDVETNIEQLRRENEGLDINTAAGVYIAESRQYGASVKEYDVQLGLVRLMKQYLQDEASGLIMGNSGFVDTNTESQITQHNNIVLRRNRLISSGEQNPVIQDMDRQIRAMRQNINRSVDNSISSLSIMRANASRQELLALSKVYEIPEKQRAMIDVERLQKTKDEIFVYLLNKREEIALNQAMVDDNARVIDPAAGSNAPVSPSLYRNILLGVGFGAGLPTVILLLILMLDTRIHSRKELENAVSIPFLGEIPMDKGARDQHICIAGQGFGMMTEAFRILRTNMQYMFRSKESKVISIISFFPSAGKTFIATNLAVSLAQISRKGVLIDLDLRRGTMSSHFEKSKKLGIAHYLSDDSMQLDDIINEQAVCENLDMISIGAIAPNPTELLLSSRLDELIVALKQRYDFIMLDSAPTGLVADASVVNRVTDLNIFIIRAGKFDRRLLPDLEKQYLQKKWNNMGVILNAVKKENRGYGYGYSYGYGYGYGYGKK